MSTSSKAPGAHSLGESEIVSERHLSRRTVLGRIGIGAGATAAVLIGHASPARAESDEEERGRGCPMRDLDNSDTARRRCGQTDND